MVLPADDHAEFAIGAEVKRMDEMRSAFDDSLCRPPRNAFLRHSRPR
jgi:hypothetical protein